jgi:predicted anti-sigma-YlaC factor YlaD
MGKRSRRRPPEPAPAPARAPAATAEPRRAVPGSRRGARPSSEDRPKPPWHPVPLVELCVLVGLVLLVLGAINHDSDRGRLLLVFGMALGSLGGLDTALREHFAGFKSHTTVLSALPGVAAAAAIFFAGVPWIAVVAGAAAVFAAAFWALRRGFMRRARRRRS